MARASRISSGVILLALSFSAHAQRPGRPFLQGRVLPPVLRRAILVQESIRFTGRRTVTVLKDGLPNRHEEIVMRDGPQIHIEFPEGSPYSGQVIVENLTERRHFLPASNEVRVLPPRREGGLQRIRALVRNGRVSTEPGERIAGFPTVEVVIQDGAGNTVQRLAIEPGSGMLLRQRFFGPTGMDIGGFVYSKVDLNPGSLDPALFKIERRGVQVTTPWDTLRKLARKSGYLPLGLPASTGFRLDSVRLAKLEEGAVLAQNYVGPGGRLSLYQLEAAVSPTRLRKQGKGVLHTLSWMNGGRTFVFVGPQDAATLAKLKGLVGKE